MATPIAPTPVLEGEEVLEFIEYISRDPTPEEMEHDKKWKKIIDDYNKATDYKYVKP